MFEDGVPPRFRLRQDKRARALSADAVSLETERPDGSRQSFTFIARDQFLESEQEIPEPHEFVARLKIGQGNHIHDFDVEFVEHDHAHAIKDYEGLDVSAPGYQGLAITMVASGTPAALSVGHVSKRWKGFGGFARKAPYFSGALIVLVELYVGYQGLAALGRA